MRLHRALHHTRDLGNAVDGLALDELQSDAGSLVWGEQVEGGVEVEREPLVARLGLALGNRRGREVFGGLVATDVVVEHVVGNAIEPGGEGRRAPEVAQVEVGLDEGVLGEVVAERHISRGLVEEESPDGRLVPHDELVESRPVAAFSSSGHKGDVVERVHVLCVELEFGAKIVVLFVALSVVPLARLASHVDLAQSVAEHKQAHAHQTLRMKEDKHHGQTDAHRCILHTLSPKRIVERSTGCSHILGHALSHLHSLLGKFHPVVVPTDGEVDDGHEGCKRSQSHENEKQDAETSDDDSADAHAHHLTHEVERIVVEVVIVEQILRDASRGRSGRIAYRRRVRASLESCAAIDRADRRRVVTMSWSDIRCSSPHHQQKRQCQ